MSTDKTTTTSDMCPRCGEPSAKHRPTLGCPYNGWVNYETWAVKLWLNNDQSTYTYWREVAQSVKDAGPQPYKHLDDLKREPVFILADRLKDELSEQMPELDASMWADLLTAAFGEVDWREIAQSMLDDLDQNGRD